MTPPAEKTKPADAIRPKGHGLKLDTPNARHHGRNGGTPLARHMVEGELVTIPDIAARRGISLGSARSRLRRAQSKSGPVTWAALSFPHDPCERPNG